VLKERAEKIRSETGNLPEIVVTGSGIQLRHMALRYSFDQPIVNGPNNELILSVAWHRVNKVTSQRNTHACMSQTESRSGPKL